jgi:predicted CXXCH cytochrome family protein
MIRRGGAFSQRFAATVLLAGFLAACGREHPIDDVDSVAAPATYVRDADCLECHEKPYEEWLNSNHDLAMQLASPESVVGNFADATFAKRAITSRFFRRDGNFMVHTEGPDGEMSDFKVAYTFGVEPLQQYLVEFPDGRIQCLTIAWDTEGQRWFDLYPNDHFPHNDSMHWTGIQFNWNHMCAKCHSTNVQKNFQPETNSFATTWSEIDVGCQACHGPGSNHIEWAGTEAAASSEAKRPFGLATDYRRGTGRYQVENCAPCHSRRYDLNPPSSTPARFMDAYVPSLLHEGLYRADGQILDEVFVYGSFLQSRMFKHGVRCTDCHNPHTLKLDVPGNDLCARCHQEVPPVLYPTLTAKNYDDASHHFHPEGSEGARCVECHMPARTYMIVDPRRDHRFGSPRPDLTVTEGIPNACNACHDDKSADWALAAVEKWYGPRDTEAFDYPKTMSLAQRRDASVFPQLQQAVKADELPPIKRATALDALFAYGAAAATDIQAALRDPDPLVRHTAAGGAVLFSEAELRQHLLPLLGDPIRAVRLTAARVASVLPPNAFSDQQRRQFDTLLEEYIAQQEHDGDRAESYANLAILRENQNDLNAAETAYRKAIAVDPHFLQASQNLAVFYSAQHRNSEAEEVLRAALKIAPNEAEFHYSLGLLLAEEERYEEAHESMRNAVENQMQQPRRLYNYALILQRTGRLTEAEQAFERGLQIDPEDVDLLYALSLQLVETGKWAKARDALSKLLALNPDSPPIQELLRHVLEQESGP